AHAIIEAAPCRKGQIHCSIRMESHQAIRHRPLVVAREGAAHVQIPRPIPRRRDAKHRIVEPRPRYKAPIHCSILMESHQTIRDPLLAPAREGSAPIHIPRPTPPPLPAPPPPLTPPP